MFKYNLHFRAVLHYHQVHSQQRTAEHFNVSRTHLRRWTAAMLRFALILKKDELAALTFVIGAVKAWNRICVAFQSDAGSTDKLMGLNKADLA
ncbi:helix-turn-helix domain-containing protein [Neisseria weixii]|uniref:helix-turn-helix domain-containing protein n=1 Tax=Neisseria weixii TaxID=1853276 RepID=UPI001F2542A2|nr:helix-turn-helix domain-containing protein [Neisseria weixii]